MAKSMSPDDAVRVAIVEDNSRARQSLAKLLEGHQGITCVAACESADAALRHIPDCRPHVTLMDINLPGTSGIQCTALLKQRLPETQILMLTAYSDSDYIFEALQAGASGYLLKSIAPDELIRSIREVVSGGAPMSGMIARQVIEAFRKPAPTGLDQTQLTTRENEILQLLARGYSNKEIASQLNCSTGTVSIHLEHIYEKLHVHCHAEATAKYLGGQSRGGETPAVGEDVAPDTTWRKLVRRLAARRPQTGAGHGINTPSGHFPLQAVASGNF